MSGTHGVNLIASVSSTLTGTYSELPIKSMDLERIVDLKDDTDSTNDGYMSRIVGLKDTSFSVEINWSPSNTARTTLMTALNAAAGSTTSYIYIKVIPDGVTGNGIKFKALIENNKQGATVSDAITESFSFKGVAAPVLDNA
jgi:hypothetical protein